MEIRYEKAVRELLETALPLKEIALECGLTSSSYLCRLIREHTGLTPGELRENPFFNGKPNPRRG